MKNKQKTKKRNLKGNCKNNNKNKRKNKQKTKYKVKDWRKYNESLKNRGDVTFWISEDVIEEWLLESKTDKRGRPKKYSDKAIEVALTAKEVFGIPLRQTEGFLKSVFQMMNIYVPVPDYSTLSLRAVKLQVNIKTRKVQGKNIHVVVDSTGVKIHGEGEWKTKKHGWSKNRRWKKLHIAVNENTNDIVAAKATGNDICDADVLPDLLNQTNIGDIGKISADGAYDIRRAYKVILKRGNVDKIAIPPQKNAKIWKHGNNTGVLHPRDENLRFIRKHGRKKWKEESEYHRRSLSETTMFRLKSVFGEKITARKDSTQKTQFLIRCKVLNKMNTLGMPESYAVC